MDPVDYFIGMSFGNDNYYQQQELLEAMYYYVEKTTIFDTIESNLTEDFRFCGSAEPLEQSIKLINSGDNEYGLAILNRVVYPRNGFITKFTWAPSSCDDDGFGGEG